MKMKTRAAFLSLGLEAKDPHFCSGPRPPDVTTATVCHLLLPEGSLLARIPTLRHILRLRCNMNKMNDTHSLVVVSKLPAVVLLFLQLERKEQRLRADDECDWFLSPSLQCLDGTRQH